MNTETTVRLSEQKCAAGLLIFSASPFGDSKSHPLCPRDQEVVVTTAQTGGTSMFNTICATGRLRSVSHRRVMFSLMR